MISRIKILGLKSIANLDINCSKLNIIAGTNSSGKSTLLQAVLLFFQTYTSSTATFTIPVGLNGSLVSLGEFRENKSFNVTDSKIVIKLKFSNISKELEVSFKEDENLQCIYEDNSEEGEELIDILESCSDDNDEYMVDNLKYLSCNRIGVQDVFNKNYTSEDLGQNGEYAIYYLEQNKTQVIDKDLIKDTSSETLSSQVNYWLKYIVDATISTEDIIGTDIIKASYSVGNGRASRPKNVGSGISYLISILVLCLSAEKNDILIIENPEIHLHPRAQSKLCEFLYFVAKSGRQIFLETHSDHIFNGIRAGIATSEMESKDITVNFLNLNNGCTENTVIEFGKRGRILNYTDGLFDQFDLDLNKMLNL